MNIPGTLLTSMDVGVGVGMIMIDYGEHSVDDTDLEKVNEISFYSTGEKRRLFSVETLTFNSALLAWKLYAVTNKNDTFNAASTEIQKIPLVSTSDWDANMLDVFFDATQSLKTALRERIASVVKKNCLPPQMTDTYLNIVNGQPDDQIDASMPARSKRWWFPQFQDSLAKFGEEDKDDLRLVKEGLGQLQLIFLRVDQPADEAGYDVPASIDKWPDYMTDSRTGDTPDESNDRTGLHVILPALA